MHALDPRSAGDLRHSLASYTVMKFIPRLSDSHAAVTIMPFTGIQVFEAGLDLDKQKSFRRDFWEEHLPQTGKTQLHRIEADQGSRDYLVKAALGAPRRIVPSDGLQYQARAADALDTFERSWIPVPIFRMIRQQSLGRAEFDLGPTTWARLYIAPLEQPDERGNSHRLVFALDTCLAREPVSPGDGPYLTPLNEDSEQKAHFALVDDANMIDYFIKAHKRPEDADAPAEAWLHRVFTERRLAKWIAGGKDPKKFDAQPRERVCEEVAHYLTLLDLINDAAKLPTFVMAGTLSKYQSQPIVRVDLVLDIGNSRTCGMLIESHPDEAHPTLNKSYPLELRDLSRPERVYAEPFDSRVEFAKADFGYEQIAHRTGRNNAFLWLSLVRTGPEATDLSIRSRGGGGATGLSSPKRYLWDEEAREQRWHFNMSRRRGTADVATTLVESPVMVHITDDGRVLSTLTAREREKFTEAYEPRFSRCALFTFLLHEILLHAFVQINAISNRMLRANQDSLRVLDKVVLTLPPGMPLPERRKFEERAKAAVKLLWDCFADSFSKKMFSHESMPKVADYLDEASCTQLVYLYSEVQRLGLTNLVAAYGRERLITERKDGREVEHQAPTLRIASIDIGGGTTDLMVITHEIQNWTEIIPHQNFRESFRLAGDDILREVISINVLRSIEAYAGERGISNPLELTGSVFGADHGKLSESERQRRRQLVLEVIVPIGLSILTGARMKQAAQIQG